MTTLNSLLAQADNLRFKLLAIIGKDPNKKEKIIDYLTSINWTTIDVEKELIEIKKELEKDNEKIAIKLQTKIKEWFNSKPNNIVLVNAGILYHKIFLKMSPVGAFKYNSRNKNCVIFLEDETSLGKRVYHGEIGSDDYYDQEISDILVVKIEEIDETFKQEEAIRKEVKKQSELNKNAIGKLFQFHQIKDVIDIDSDIKDKQNQIEIISSYVISESLEDQICDFFTNLERPDHKANTIIGNYGSGKSHLIATLVSLVNEPSLAEYVSSDKVKKAVKEIDRKFYTVQFELQSGQVPLKTWFFDKIQEQLKDKYNIDIPDFVPDKEYDAKKNVQKILEIIKNDNPSNGLLVVIDEISDFLASKQKEAMKSDLQFLRVIGQICMDKDQDLMFIGSMQEDVFSSPKFKDIASEIGRVEERFLPIIIHKEDVQKVISQRIVFKTKEQRHKLEEKLADFAEKIDPVSTNLDDFVDLFPLTPFIIDLFSDLPYFEKRGIIQFATNEIKYILNNDFPYFITFEKIYDVLEDNPNKKNIEEIYEITKVMNILKSKINLLDDKLRPDAIKVIKALAVYSLWGKKESGVTAKELANNLMLMPVNKILSAEDNLSRIVKKIREVTDGEYVKSVKDEETSIEYFKLETKAGIDPEEKISQKASSVSDDEVEAELFTQIAELLELERMNGQMDVYHDECEWKAVKSFREGYVAFVKKDATFKGIEKKDYAVVFISPFVNKFNTQFSDLQLTIKIHLPEPQHIEQIKEIIAIKALLNSNFQKHNMLRKLEERMEGYSRGATPFTGLKYRLSKLLMNFTDVHINGKEESIKQHLGREFDTVPEILDALKCSVFDRYFNEKYKMHPSYSIQLSKNNILDSLSNIANDLVRQSFNNISINATRFLESVEMLDSAGYPNALSSKIAQQILTVIKKNKTSVTDIQKEIITLLSSGDYGVEKEFVYFILVLLTINGKVYLQAKGGDKIDINNIKDKYKSLAMFETVQYVRFQDAVSYDFAAKLFNTIGLNGAKISKESDRLDAFNEYKSKISEINKRIAEIDNKYQELKEKQQVFIALERANEQLLAIKDIKWDKLDISNHTQFNSIESYLEQENINLAKIKLSLENMKNLEDALGEYIDSIHSGITYIENALSLIKDNEILVVDVSKHEKLQEIRSDLENICKDFNKYIDRSERNPIKGKIQQFRQLYKYGFYLPAHKKYVGEGIKWNNLDSYNSSNTFHRLLLLRNITCIAESKLNQQINSWQDLKKYQCCNNSLDDELELSVRCNKCSFPENSGDGKYSKISPMIDEIDTVLESTLKQYEDKIIKEIRQYQDNIQYQEDSSLKKFLAKLVADKKLPDSIDNAQIQSINQLFKEIDVVEIDGIEDILERLFPNGEMITLDDFRKTCLAIEEDIRKNKDVSEIRIKLK